MYFFTIFFRNVLSSCLIPENHNLFVVLYIYKTWPFFRRRVGEKVLVIISGLERK
jgi:hypothetical protein